MKTELASPCEKSNQLKFQILEGMNHEQLP